MPRRVQPCVPSKTLAWTGEWSGWFGAGSCQTTGMNRRFHKFSIEAPKEGLETMQRPPQSQQG